MIICLSFTNTILPSSDRQRAHWKYMFKAETDAFLKEAFYVIVTEVRRQTATVFQYFFITLNNILGIQISFQFMFCHKISKKKNY